MKNYFRIVLLLGTTNIFFIGFVFSQVINTTFSSTMDTYVASNSTASNYGVTTQLFAGRYPNRTVVGQPTTYHTRRSFIYFLGIAGIPNNAIILSAQLKVYAAAASAGTPNFYLRRNTSSWIESGTGSVTYANQPTYETSDQLTFSGTATTGYISIDVKSHVQSMVAEVYTNYGWTIHVDNELYDIGNRYQEFDPREQGASFEPKVEISYYIPMSVTNATIVHANTSSLTETTGSISPVLANGPGGTYTYQWYNSSGLMSGKTALNLSGVPYGWYGLKVTSSVAGVTPFFYAFLVGVNCEEVAIPFNPGPDYIDDAMIRNSIGYTTINYGTSYQLIDAYERAGYWEDYDARMNLLRFRLWIDEEIMIEEGNLLLRSQTNLSPVGNNNGAQFHHVTSDWSEGMVTYSSIPDYTNSPVAFPMPATSASNTDHVIDILAALENLQENNVNNYGWLFRLNNYDNVVTRYQRYYSSEHTTVNYRPRINFLISVSNPTAPNYCNQVFAKMDRTLRGVLYKPYLTHLYFYYDEEYATSDAGLNYRVYKADTPLASILNHTIQPLTEIEYGDNRYTLDIGGLQEGVYVLEITNNKSEKFYLRFKVED